MATTNATSGAGKGKKKSKGRTITLTDFLNDGGKGSIPDGFAVRHTNWADMMEEENELPSFGKKDANVVLPTAPKAARSNSVDVSRVPLHPPYKIHIGNIPYETTEEEIASLFNNLKIVNIQLPKDESSGNRLRGFGYAEFESRDSLIEALAFDSATLNGRSLRISLPGESDSDRRGGRDDHGEDRTDNDWRSARGPLPPREGGPPRDDGFSRNGRGFEERSGGFEPRGDRYEPRRQGGFDRGVEGRSENFDRSQMQPQSGGGFGGRERGGFENHRSGGGFDRDNNRGGSDRDNRGGFDRSDRGGFDSRGGNDRGGSRGYDRDNQDSRYKNFERHDRRDDRYNDRRDDGYGSRDDRRGDDRGGYGGGRPQERDSYRDAPRRDDGPPRPRYNDSAEPTVEGGHADGGEPKERPKLKLQPRSKPVESADTAASSAIFGGAKPVDTLKRELEIEARLKSEHGPPTGDSEQTTERVRRVSANSNSSATRSRKVSESSQRDDGGYDRRGGRRDDGYDRRDNRRDDGYGRRDTDRPRDFGRDGGRDNDRYSNRGGGGQSQYSRRSDDGGDNNYNRDRQTSSRPSERFSDRPKSSTGTRDEKEAEPKVAYTNKFGLLSPEGEDNDAQYHAN